MKTIKLILSLLILCFVVTGCGIEYPMLASYDMPTKKTSIEDFSKLNPALGSPSVIQANSTDYKVYSIEVLTGSSEVNHSYMDGNKTKTRTTHAAQLDSYFFVFHNNYYIYSGFLYEFLNSKDQSIKGIGATLRSTFGTEGRTMKI